MSLIDELIRREGADSVVRMVNEGARYPVSSVEELRQRLRRDEGGVLSDPEGAIAP